MPIKRKKNLRSQQWFNNPKDPEMTALYLERYLNYGLTRKELSDMLDIQYGTLGKIIRGFSKDIKKNPA